MLYNEIIRSCSHQAVAAAAVRSIGGEFCSRIELLSGAHGLSIGAYTAQLVHQFAAEADEDTWRELASAIARRDMPILAGLCFIVEKRIDGEMRSGKSMAAVNSSRAGLSSSRAKLAAVNHLAA